MIHLFGKVYGWTKQDVMELTPGEVMRLQDLIAADLQAREG